MKNMTLTLPGEIMFTRVAAQTAASAAAILNGTSGILSESSEFVNAFELAISEAFTNAVRYAGKKHEPQTVTITFSLDEGCLTITLRDANPPFSIDTPEPDITDYPENGYGLLIIRKLMDKVTYSREEGLNVITMSKHI
jgi:serine/threonine-protein kinase RsbW